MAVSDIDAGQQSLMGTEKDGCIGYGCCIIKLDGFREGWLYLIWILEYTKLDGYREGWLYLI